MGRKLESEVLGMRNLLLCGAAVLLFASCAKVKDPLYDCPDFSAKKKTKVKQQTHYYHPQPMQVIEVKEKTKPRYETRDY